MIHYNSIKPLKTPLLCLTGATSMKNCRYITCCGGHRFDRNLVNSKQDNINSVPFIDNVMYYVYNVLYI